MVASRKRRWLGFAMLGVIAAVCLLSNLVVLWLARQPMAIQPVGLSFIIDLYLISQAVWGIVWVQPVLLGIYLAYAKPSAVRRAIVGVAVLALMWAAYWLGFCLLFGSSRPFFIPYRQSWEMLWLWSIGTISCAFAMWGSRISRGWRLVSEVEEERMEKCAPPIARSETVAEIVMLLLFVVAAISGPEWFRGRFDSGIGVICFCVLALVATIVLAPTVFVSLRYRQLAAVCVALFGLVIGLPAALGGIVWFFVLQLGGSITANDFVGPLVIALFASGTLAATLMAIRLAGYRLQQRRFEKKLVAKTPVDPFSD